ncbi:MAG: hypothetical protein WAL75_01570 [Terracidiphilus sp.]
MSFDKERLSYWLAGVLLAWTMYVAVFGIPIFHLLLGIAIPTIVSFAVYACALQLAITPWIFSARVTLQNPQGKIGQRTAAIIIWFVSTASLLLYFMQRRHHAPSEGNALRGYSFDAAVVLIPVALFIVEAVWRSRRRLVARTSK